MISFKRITAAILAVSTAVTVSACSSSGSASNASSGGGAQSSDDAASTNFTTIDDEIENPVDVSDISIDPGLDADDVEPADLQYLGNYDITTAGDIKPAYKYFQENYGCNINCTIVGSLQIEEKLTAAISSGESPDLVDYQNNTFPLMMSKNIYTPLNDYIDLNTPQWAGLEKYVKKYTWGGNNYYYPWMYNISPEMLIYNRKLFEELSIEDPKELYDAGNWTWATLKSCIQKFVDSGDDREGIYGYASTSVIDSTGVALVAIGEDGSIECNLVNPAVERAASYMQSLRDEGLGKTVEGYINVSEEPILQGLSAFQAMGSWIITNYSKKMSKDDTLDIFFVPFPKDPNADDYYYAMSTFGYLVPAGSKYAKQASVFINCCRLSTTDEALKQTTKESIMKNKKYTEEQYEFLTEFSDITKFNGVIDEPYGLDETTSTIIRGMLDEVIFGNVEEFQDMTWTQMRESNSATIMAQVDYYNKLIQSGNAQ